MPNNAPKIKIENTKKYKAEVILYDPLTQSRENIGEKISKDENRTLIRPYDDLDIIAGQGTVGKEISEQLQAEGVQPLIIEVDPSRKNAAEERGLKVPPIDKNYYTRKSNYG